MVCAERASATSAAVDRQWRTPTSSEVTDEFVEPAGSVRSPRGMRDGDAVVFFNFRPDRAREITRALADPDFAGFARKNGLCRACISCA